MAIGFDVISDLCLLPEDEFNWEGKATSLYCIIAGNISSDLKTTRKALAHLSQCYQGVFYCLGTLEYENCSDIDQRTKELTKLFRSYRNVALLHQHVVVVENVAILGINGWNNIAESTNSFIDIQLETYRNEDIIYLKESLEKLQRHLDVKSIILVSNAVPSQTLYFGQEPTIMKSKIPLDVALLADTEQKITHWIYGTYDKNVDITIDSINYINNSSYRKQPYYSKRIEL